MPVDRSLFNRFQNHFTLWGNCAKINQTKKKSDIFCLTQILCAKQIIIVVRVRMRRSMFVFRFMIFAVFMAFLSFAFFVYAPAAGQGINMKVEQFASINAQQDNIAHTFSVNGEVDLSTLVENTKNLGKTTLDLSGLELNSLSDLESISLDGIIFIDLTNNNLTSESLPSLAAILSRNTSISHICLFNNLFDLPNLPIEYENETRLVFGVQKFEYGDYVFNDTVLGYVLWQEAYNSNFGFMLNGEATTPPYVRTLYTIYGGEVNFKIVGKGDYESFQSDVKTQIVNFTINHNLIFERVSDIGKLENLSEITSITPQIEGMEVKLKQDVDLSQIVVNQEIIFQVIKDENVLFEKTSLFSVQDTTAPFLDFKQDNGVIFVEHNSEFELEFTFIDNTEEIEKVNVVNSYILPNTATDNNQFALGYQLYELPKGLENIEISSQMDFSDLVLIDGLNIETDKLSKRYVLRYQAADPSGNKTEISVLEVQICGKLIKDSLEEKLEEAVRNLLGKNDQATLFVTDFVERGLKNVELYNKSLTSIKGLSNFSFENVEMLNLAFNELTVDSIGELNEIAEAYPTMQIVCFFNNIENATAYASNIILGTQNIKDFYLNASPEETYFEYDDYKALYDYSIYFKSCLDGSILFSFGGVKEIYANNDSVLNGTAFNVEKFSNSFPQAGQYILRYSEKEGQKLFAYELTVAEIALYNENLEVEAGSDFKSESLRFSAGILSENFIIEVVDEKGQEFNATQLGDFELTYHIYEKNEEAENGENQKGELLTSLTQNIKVVDTLGPTITPIHQVGYCYYKEAYTDTGVTANDYIDGVCFVEVRGVINSNILGEQTIQYYSVDTRGNESLFTKKVVVIHKPVSKIEIKHKEENVIGEKLNFSVKFFAGEHLLSADAVTYNVYIDGNLRLSQSGEEFSLVFDELGRNIVTVKVVSKNLLGEDITQIETLEIDYIEDAWWVDDSTKINMAVVFFGVSLVVFVIILLSKRLIETGPERRIKKGWKKKD